MKDLFVLTADSDAEAVMRSILVRHKDLGSPVRARHDQGSSKASISKGERERGGREAVNTGAGLSYGLQSATAQGISWLRATRARKFDLIPATTQPTAHAVG